MNTKMSAGIAVLLATTSMASAGGMDRSTTSTSILFEKGTYAELAYASTKPSVTPDTHAAGEAIISSSWNVAEDFTTTNFGMKTDLSEKLSVALTFSNQPFGVDINYAPFAASLAPTVAPLASLRANLDGTALTMMGKYKITERVSAIAGLKYQTVGGSANVSVPLMADGNVTLNRANDTNYIVGAAYEIEDIALRVCCYF